MTHAPMGKWRVIADAFVELADTVADDHDPLDLLQALVNWTAELVDGATAVLVLNDYRNHLRLAASSDDSARTLALFATPNEVGPCLDSFRDGATVVNVLGEQALTRWPAFTASAHDAGFAATHVVPMRIRDSVLGALAVLFRDRRALADEEVAMVEALASVSTVGLLQERTPRQREVLVERLQTTLILRVVIEQAKGVVAQSLGVDVDTAFVLLRNHAVRAHHSLGVTSDGVLRGHVDPADLLLDAPAPKRQG